MGRVADARNTESRRPELKLIHHSIAAHKALLEDAELLLGRTREPQRVAGVTGRLKLLDPVEHLEEISLDAFDRGSMSNGQGHLPFRNVA
jgi:hypothetical protein